MLNWLVVVFAAGFAAADPAGAMENILLLGTLVDVDIAGVATFSEDGAVTVIFGT